MIRSTVTAEERFWSYVDKSSSPDSCWIWSGASKTSWGYGVFFCEGRLLGAHRYSWSLANGRMPSPKEFVCHSCDRPACVNPRHLWLGDHKTNMSDMSKKGRGHSNGLVGERHPMAKLSDEQVRLIRKHREDGAPVRLIAAEFGISVRHTYDILAGEHRKCA